MSRGFYILFRSTKIHLFPVVVLGMSQAIAWPCQMVEHQELFSISTQFILDILLPCFVFPGIEVPGNMFVGGYALWNLCYSSALELLRTPFYESFSKGLETFKTAAQDVLPRAQA